MSWRDLLVTVQQAPAGSALDRAMNPEGSAWGVQEHLTALVADLLNVANWQRSGDAKAPRPDPVPRPGDRQPQKRGHTKEEIDEWLARRQVAAKQDDETEG